MMGVDFAADGRDERLSAIRDSGVDFDARRIFIVGEVDDEKAEKVITAVHVLDQADGDIHVTLSSSGGEEPAGYAIHDALALARNRVVIEGYGQVSSIAAVILQAGDWRRLAPSCEFMIHNGHRDFEGEKDNNEIQRIAREIDFDNKRYRDVLYRGCARFEEMGRHVTPDLLKELCDQETFFTAQEAVHHGFADEIITRKKS